MGRQGKEGSYYEDVHCYSQRVGWNPRDVGGSLKRARKAERGMYQDGKDFRKMLETKGSHILNSLESLLKIFTSLGLTTKLSDQSGVFHFRKSYLKMGVVIATIKKCA